jgi:hypothetical protein
MGKFEKKCMKKRKKQCEFIGLFANSAFSTEQATLISLRVTRRLSLDMFKKNEQFAKENRETDDSLEIGMLFKLLYRRLSDTRQTEIRRVRRH